MQCVQILQLPLDLSRRKLVWVRKDLLARILDFAVSITGPRVLRRALRRAHFNCIGILLKWPPRLRP